MANFTLEGAPFHTSGELPPIGSPAPDFRLVAADLSDVTLATYRGKTKLLAFVPSLDTGVCAASARRLNEKGAALPNAVVLMISADLPFAMKRFCAGEKLRHIVPLSMMRGRGAAKSYGVLIVDGPFEGTCARAVVVVAADDTIVYRQLVPELSNEPDYEAALAAIPR